jgi:hypothetical protein
MWEDDIVNEVHAIREQLLARFGGDLHLFCEYVRTHPVPVHADAPVEIPVVLPGKESPPKVG